MRQWLSCVLTRYAYVTFRMVAEDGSGYCYQAFQVLDLERRNIVIRPFMDMDEQAEQEGLYIVTLQPLQIWREDDLQQLPETLETFIVHDPVKVDVITAIGISADSRSAVWGARLSDIEGCTQLHDKELLVSRPVDLMGSRVPVLSLLDELQVRGFTGIDEVVHHRQDLLSYDRRRPSGRRSYFQCVLHTGALAQRGVLEFHSSGSNAYFEALLRSKRKVRAGLLAIEYRRMLAIERGDDLALAALAAAGGPSLQRPAGKRKAKAKAKALEAGQPPPPQLALEAGQPPAGGDEESEGSVFGGSFQPRPEGAGSAGHGDQGAASPEREVAVAGPPASVAASRRSRLGLPAGVPAQILGSAVLLVRGRLSDTHIYHDRITVRCTNPAHKKCAKSRSLVMLQNKFGRVARRFSWELGL